MKVRFMILGDFREVAGQSLRAFVLESHDRGQGASPFPWKGPSPS